MEKNKILIVCGEPSGDLQAGMLVHALKDINPSVSISAVGGDSVRREGAEIIADIKDFAVLGFFDVLRKLPLFFSLRRLILDKISTGRFDAVILVDFSGFNLRLARKINKRIAVIYYISPQVWASRKGRIASIKKFVDKLIVIFPFEKDFYKKHGIEAEYVGNPLLDIVKPPAENNEFFTRYSLSRHKPVFCLLPGSRNSEVRYILPVMLASCRHIQKAIGEIQVIIARSTTVDKNTYLRILDRSGSMATIVDGQAHDCIRAADFCLVASGTATLETALFEKPMVVIYKIGALNYFLYKPQVKIPYIGMVNIVAGKEVAAEFIQRQAQPRRIADSIVRLYADPEAMASKKRELADIRAYLGPTGAAPRAAKIIIAFLNNT